MVDHNKLVNESALRAHMDKITELRFGPTVKVIRTRDGTGWKLLVEGIAGGAALNFKDGFLYRANSDHNIFSNPDFCTSGVAEAIGYAVEIAANLGDRGMVVDPGRGFISKFLNPVAFDRQHDHWRSDEARIQLVSR